MLFDLEDPFAADCVLRGMRRNKGPSLIGEESIKLMIHWLTPFGMLGCYGEARWFSEIRIGGGGSKEGFWQGITYGIVFGKIGFGDLVFGAGDHWVGVGSKLVDDGGNIGLRRRDGCGSFWS